MREYEVVRKFRVRLPEGTDLAEFADFWMMKESQDPTDVEAVLKRPELLALELTYSFDCGEDYSHRTKGVEVSLVDETVNGERPHPWSPGEED